MNLAARRSTRLREDFVIRLGCLLVSFAVLASLILEPPRAKAFALTSSAVTALAGGFLSACGLTPVVSGMNNSGEVNESVARLLQEFLDEEVFGISVADGALSFGEIGLAVKDKKIVIPKPFAEKLGQFAAWVASKYATKPGMNAVYGVTDTYVTLQDGRTLYFSTFGWETGQAEVATIGSVFNCDTDFPIVFSTGYYFDFVEYGKSATAFFDPEGNYIAGFNYSSISDIIFLLTSDGRMWVYSYVSKEGVFRHSTYVSVVPAAVRYVPIGDVVSPDESLSLDVSDTMQQVLDRLTALEEGQSIALDVGATQSMEIQEILQGILDAILAGDLAASAEIVDAAEVPVDPEEPDPPVVPELPSGLDRLGAALTSRFPFSIPWDVYKGVTLLAAPPKAPYFEVDFMAPIADRVGGWQGSTKIVLDMSEYEIIGQVCRWTSTIGFCLMLATGTKRLIWTA